MEVWTEYSPCIEIKNSVLTLLSMPLLLFVDLYISLVHFFAMLFFSPNTLILHVLYLFVLDGNIYVCNHSSLLTFCFFMVLMLVYRVHMGILYIVLYSL